MSKMLNVLMVMVISLLSVLLILTNACKTKPEAILGQLPEPQTSTSQAIVPYLPPDYYECTEVLPMDLENAFYSNYGNTAGAGAMYGGRMYVFKNLIVDAFMIREVDKGWLWADLIKCPVLNLDAAKKLQPGERIDIAGYCVGRDITESPGLVFRDCMVLQAGSVQLPAPGGGNTFAPVY